jgi:hypothetical protein
MGEGYETFHIKEENADYFLIVIGTTRTIYIAVFTDIAHYWEVYVAGTRIVVPGDHPATEQVKTEAYGYALLHPSQVTRGLYDEALMWCPRLPDPRTLGRSVNMQHKKPGRKFTRPSYAVLEELVGPDERAIALAMVFWENLLIEFGIDKTGRHADCHPKLARKGFPPIVQIRMYTPANAPDVPRHVLAALTRRVRAKKESENS